MKTCSCDKAVYHKKSEAQAAAFGIWDDDKIKMVPYKCPEGNFYHLATAKTGKTLRHIPHGMKYIKISITKKRKRK